MGKSKKKTDWKNAVTFRLVHRSQRDPLISDDTAPQRVLVPTVASASDTRFNNAVESTSRDARTDEEKLNARYEQELSGIHFDDDYDYTQHLRDVRNEPMEWTRVDRVKQSKKEREMEFVENQILSTVTLPSNFFPSVEEESEGMLAKGLLPVGPQPDWDPDVVAALDEDFDFDDPENQIEDDFITMAGGVDESEQGAMETDDPDLWEGQSLDGNQRDEDTDSDGTLVDSEDDNDSEDKKTCFTGYSMTSSVIRRNEGLTNLDSQFETLYEKEYGDETELGALDLHTIEGYIDPNKNDRITRMVKDFKEEQSLRLCDAFTKDQRVIDKRYQRKSDADLDSDTDSEDSEEELENMRIDKYAAEDRLDCESVLSTYSSLYNHPKLIIEPRKNDKVTLDPKTGLPVDRPDLCKGITSAKLAQLDRANCGGQGDVDGSVNESRLSQLSIRSKDETPEERKARKAALREYRRERRQERKANKEAFKEEKSAIDKQVLNTQNRLKSVKIV